VLPAYLAPAVPLDDPSKHQGRTGTMPHVDGQWAAYVYVPLALRGALRRVVTCAMDIASKEMATLTSTSLHVLGTEGSGAGSAGTTADVRKLHVLLTWPFFSVHKSEGGYEARSERCCQGLFSEHVFLRCGSPMQRCPLPHLRLSY